MCCPGIYRGRTIRWVIRFILFCSIVSMVSNLIQYFTRFCGNSALGDMNCSLQAYLIATFGLIGMLAIWCLAVFFHSLFLKRFLARHFPMTCGHRRYNFTGKSSKTLKEILLTIDSELPPEEVYQEEQNTVVRFLNDIRDSFKTHVTPAASWEYIFVGSMAERYGIPFSFERGKMLPYVHGLRTDVDVMFCFDHEAMEASFSGREGNIINVVLVNPFLGFAKLMFKESGDEIKSNEIMEQAKYSVTSTKVTNLPRMRLCRGRDVSFGDLHCKIAGPAINVAITNFVNFDITPCIKCSEWPPLSDWPTRRRCWPSQEDVTRIVSHGCHLVAKPEPFDKGKTSWRFSFSVAEVELSKLVPNTARKCFLALKVILKDHLEPVLAGITSYHLKTIFFNTLEKMPVDFWVDENIEECFFSLLNEVHNALVSGDWLHFWFRSVNLFGKFNDPKQLAALIRKVERIAENPAPFIFDDGCCCLYPCCTRERLYDCRGNRINKRDDEVICVEHADEQECDRIELTERTSHAV